jgi:hypothetical protein
MRNRVRWPGLLALAVLLAVLVASPASAAKPPKAADYIEVGGVGVGLAPAAPDGVRTEVVNAPPVCDGFPSPSGIGTDAAPSPDCGGYIPPPPPPPTEPAPPPCCAPPPPPAPAPTPTPTPTAWIGCKTFYAYRGLNHVFGYMLYRYYVQKEFCSNGFGLYVDNTWRWVEVNVGWQFQGHIDQTQTSGTQRSYYTQGKFSPPLASSFVTRYPYLRVCYGIADNGAFSICGSGG